MDPDPGWLIALADAHEPDMDRLGGKVVRLARLAHEGFRTPGGFCITTQAYRRFVTENRLGAVIDMELGRKPLEEMRWEEVWDAALRIRSAFLTAPLPAGLAQNVEQALAGAPGDTRWAVRSSAPAEDAKGASFAGLHESRVGLAGSEAVLAAVQVVWASLWSDAALLYRRELGLDPAHSAMAVLVQPMLDSRPSGVAFGRDPRRLEREEAIVEAVDGPCGGLVDGAVEPDRYTLERPGGARIAWQPGERETGRSDQPLLGPDDLRDLMQTLLAVEALFGWAPDLEWTGRGGDCTLLQARPITVGPAPAPDDDDRRAWYLSLRPGAAPLARLCERVEHTLIPALTAECEALAAEDLDPLDDAALADAIDVRRAAFARWRRTYWDEFIPLAHGVRQLGSYYDEAVRPEDPYEFVGLLHGSPLSAMQRNRAIEALASRVREVEVLRESFAGDPERAEGTLRERLARCDEGRAFLEEADALLSGVMDVCFEGERLSQRSDLLLRLVAELAERPPEARPLRAGSDAELLERRLFTAVGREREAEARDVLRIGRTSWRLRDDDNLLLGRVESQLLHAVGLGLARLQHAGRLEGQPRPRADLAELVALQLRDPEGGRVAFAERAEPAEPARGTPDASVRPRQLVGQPAAPGFATGPARRVRDAEDLGRFRNGDVLICDAIQPTMTQLVPLCAAIVERRGGMLIHGAIIARELGIPCVNGVARAVESIRDGDWLSVDGDLGLVTVGAPEFDLEQAGGRNAASGSAPPAPQRTP